MSDRLTNKRKWTLFAAGIALPFSLTVGVRAATLTVPGQYPTIQAALDAAANTGDEIIVAPGMYNEAINFLGKAVYLHSSDGAAVTTIDAQGNGSVVVCAGHMRVWDGDGNGSLVVDMGTYEFASHAYGDMNGDGMVDLSDLAILLANFGIPDGAGVEQGDTDGDGDVDLQDLARLLSNFGRVAP
ncbi:MAG: hypothetical protein AMXMBFR47_10020 [Planctomycetota bacterium]